MDYLHQSRKSFVLKGNLCFKILGQPLLSSRRHGGAPCVRRLRKLLGNISQDRVHYNAVQESWGEDEQETEDWFWKHVRLENISSSFNNLVSGLILSQRKAESEVTNVKLISAKVQETKWFWKLLELLPKMLLSALDLVYQTQQVNIFIIILLKNLE